MLANVGGMLPNVGGMQPNVGGMLANVGGKAASPLGGPEPRAAACPPNSPDARFEARLIAGGGPGTTPPRAPAVVGEGLASGAGGFGVNV